MAKAYMFRHQKAGIITSHVFLKRPTDAQLAPLIAECKRVHGEGWGLVHEAELLDDESPSFQDRATGAGGNKAKAAGVQFTVKAEGTVDAARETVTLTPDDVAELKIG